MISMSEQPGLVPENLEATIDLTADDIMPKGVPAVEPDTPVAAVLRVMVEYDVAGVAVVEDDEIVGIITESDVVQRQADVDAPTPVPFLDAIFVADAGRAYEEEVRRALAINARMMMSSPVTSIRHNATLEEIATVMMDLDVHPLPVVDDQGRYMGVVSRRDLVRVIAALENRVS
jgi:CBS domain-containing protein